MTDDLARLLCLLAGVALGGGGMWLIAAKRITRIEDARRTVARLRGVR